MRLRRRVALALATGLVLLAAAELGLRRWYPVGRTTYRPDPELLHTTIPGSRRVQIMAEHAGGARVLVEIGPDGFRGPALERVGTRPRLVVAGDSLVMSENVPYPETFPVRLAAHLAEEPEPVNLGVSGYGPDQALLRLERRWDDLDPDLVLLVLCATNDHGDVVRNKLFRLDAAGDLRRQRTRLGPDVRAHFRRAADRSDDLAVVRLVRSAIAAREREATIASEGRVDLVPLYLEVAEREWADHERGDPVVRDLFRDYYDADVAVAPTAPSTRGKRALMGALLARWGEALRERVTPLRVVVVPSAVDLDPTFRIRVDAGRHPEYDPRAQSRALTEAAAAAGVPVLDLYPLFEANEPSTLFVGHDDIHWNARGIELAAREVAAWLEDG